MKWLGRMRKEVYSASLKPVSNCVWGRWADTVHEKARDQFRVIGKGKAATPKSSVWWSGAGKSSANLSEDATEEVLLGEVCVQLQTDTRKKGLAKASSSGRRAIHKTTAYDQGRLAAAAANWRLEEVQGWSCGKLKVGRDKPPQVARRES